MTGKDGNEMKGFILKEGELVLLITLVTLGIDKETLGYNEARLRKAINNFIAGNEKKETVTKEICLFEDKVKALNIDIDNKNLIIKTVEEIKKVLEVF